MLKQRLMAYMWCGVAINIVAMVLVSMTNFLSADEDQINGLGSAALGTVFILLSCVVQVGRWGGRGGGRAAFVKFFMVARALGWLSATGYPPDADAGCRDRAAIWFGLAALSSGAGVLVKRSPSCSRFWSSRTPAPSIAIPGVVAKQSEQS